jgi:hypothetical protein
MLAKFSSKGASQAGESAFRSRVGVNCASSKNTNDGRHEYNSPVPLATHWRCCLLSQKKGGFKIGRENVIPSFQRPICELCAMDDASIGYQNV